MKRIIFFFGSFDPLHKGHISIINEAIKAIDASFLYLGINKNSNKGKLSPCFKRIEMLKEYSKNNDKIKVLNFAFDYKNLDKTYKKIFSMMKEENEYYILLGQDQINNLKNWYKYDELITKFKFIIAQRGNTDFNNGDLTDNNKFLFIKHQYPNISSLLVKEGNYKYTDETIKKYIIDHNLYLELQIKKYLTDKRYLHSISVKNTALLINKKAHLNIDKYQVEKASLLHDIAKNLDSSKEKELVSKCYPQYRNENEKIIHQYLGAYIAENDFYVKDENILNAIKFHTTGRKEMSKLEKLIYLADKIEPTRNYNTSSLIKLACKNFNQGFIEVVKNNKKYLENNKIKITNKDTIECFNYYLK